MRTDEHPDPIWATRFEDAAGTDPADVFDVADDLERGRLALRRRRVLVGSGGSLAAAVVLGTALLVAPGGDVTRSVAPAGGESPAAPTFQEPSTTLEPTPAPPAPTVGAGTGRDPVADLMERRGATQEWRDDLYALAGEVMDPGGTHLDYSTNSMQGGSDGRGGLALGIKLGWTTPSQPGEGMLQVEVSDLTGPDAIGPEVYLGAPMRERTLANGATIRVGETDDGSFAVSHRQPDGETVWVLWNPLFGNNSVTPVAGSQPRRVDVIRFVQDERLDLPPH